MNYFDQGVEFYNQKKFIEAKDCFLNAISHDQNKEVAHHNLGVTYLQLKENEKAIESLQYSCDSYFAESYVTRGAAYRNIGRYFDSLKDFSMAFTIDPYNATAYSNYSNTLREFGKPDMALEFIKIANKLKPDNTSLLNESITYLTLGDLTEGWEKYNYRWFYETGESLKPNLPGTEYDGTQELNQKTILVYCEQGFGDCIQFVRYLTLLEQRNANVILLSKPDLSKLFEYNYPNVKVIDWGKTIPQYDYHVALLDLPKCFNTTIDTIPNFGAYISVEEKFKNQWNKILGPKTKLRIGLNWSSNPIAFNTKFKAIELTELLKLVNDDYEFINLNYTATEQENQLLVDHNIKNYNNQITNFYDTAGLLSNLDCVITVDTAIAHLAGAMGVNAYILLTDYGCDWRWFLNREDSPFYSSVKLFRKTEGSWDNVVKSLTKHLEFIG